MAYFSPFIDESGLHIPTYIDLRDQLIEEIKQIYGQDIYLDPDSADYQFISIVSRKIFDSYSLAALVYNNRTPITAIGVGLDNNVAFANIERKGATYSTASLTLTGTAGTVINNAQAIDENGYKWNIENCVIGSDGSVSANATCDTIGKIGALAGSINRIGTPIYGWLSVTNQFAATEGNDIETDAELRGRYSLAIRASSMTVFEAIHASIMAIPEVTRSVGFENDTAAESTGTEPPNVPAGLPPHSVTFVVEGGVDEEVAQAIYSKKTPGCYTIGTTAVEITSEVGNIDTIRFYRPTYVSVYAQVTVKKLPSWNDELEDKIKQNIVNYVEGLNIADDVLISMIWSSAITAMDDVKNPSYTVTSVQIGESSGSLSSNDLDIQFNEAAQCQTTNVTVVFA